PYNKPTQDGLVAHYREIAQVASQLPIMVYNIPGRTAVTIQASTMTEIWKIPNVLALKESSGSWQTFLDMSQHLPAKKTLLCGDDASALAFYLHGAKGLVSVLSNLCPKACIEIWDLSQKNLWTEAKNLFDRYKRLLDLLFIESNPIPIKYAVAHSIGRELLPRLPLLGLSERFRTELEREMKALQKEGHLK
ncbi:MAG: 4-hydroxy-tetrahydrodipicolinate synthase, partial [Deltaproteobacteria bacterium CG11_big_fil_rev_8_21_14_0_20_45_16]